MSCALEARRGLPVVGSLLGLLFLTGSCGEDAEPVRVPPAGVRQLAVGRDAHGPFPEMVGSWHVTRGAVPGYVDDAACRECHEDLYESYHHQGMARSLYPPDPKRPVEKLGETFYHDKSKSFYRMVERDGGYVLQRWLQDDVGGAFAQYEAKVAYVIGSGNHVRSYLTRNAHGKLFELPLSWYAESGWGMSPGYDLPRHDRFGREIVRSCLFCHTAYPEVPVGYDRTVAPHRFPETLPSGVGCQRCHGPGARHVEAAIANASDEEIRSRIVDPGEFEGAARDDLCMTCHLQPESLKDLMAWHEDRRMYQHRPGQKITDFVTFFDHGTMQERGERFEINHHAYRLRQSRCFTKSEGRLACVTCHDPHEKVPKSDQAAYYRAKCFTCHAVSDCEMPGMGTTVDAKGADCISCHMVKARPRDVVLVTVTDHRIRRKPPERDLTASIPEDFDRTRVENVTPYFEVLAGEDQQLEVRRGATWRAQEDQNQAVARFLEAFEGVSQRAPGDYVNLGRALLGVGRARRGVEVLVEGARRFPDDFAVHHALGDVRMFGLGQADEALEALTRADRLEPGHPGILKSIGDAHTIAKRWRLAREAYERAIPRDGTDPKLWLLYIQALLHLSDLDAAEEALRRAIALAPDEADLFRMLADVLGQRGRVDERRRVIRQGATLHLELRLAWVLDLLTSEEPRLRDPRRALQLAGAAVKAAPGDPRTHQYFAVAIFLSRTRADALPAIEAAAERNGDPACTAALTGIRAMLRGEHADARQHVAKFEELLRGEAPPQADPALRGVLQQVVRSMAR